MTKIIALLGLKRLFIGLLLTSSTVMATSVCCFSADLGLLEAAALKTGTSKWVILDSRPKADWEAGHLPGAIQFFWESYTRTDARGVKYSSLPPRSWRLY